MSDLIRTFSALGDPTRLAIFERLMVEGEQSAGDLQDISSISAPALSRHLKVLREAGLITRRVDAQRRIFAARPEVVRAIGDWTMTHKAFWGPSLDRLDAALTEGD